MNVDNRRQFQRVDLDGKVDLEFVNYRYDCCQMRNLSLTGMFVEGPFLKGKKAKNCLVKIFHEDKSGNNSMCASAKVVWKSDRGVGLQFTTMTFENYLLLQTTLINKAEKPEIILRELPEKSPFFIES